MKIEKNDNKIHNWICIHLYMNVYKIIYPLLECRSWLPFFNFYVKKRSGQIFKFLSFISLYMCLI